MESRLEHATMMMFLWKCIGKKQHQKLPEKTTFSPAETNKQKSRMSLAGLVYFPIFSHEYKTSLSFYIPNSVACGFTYA